MSIILKTESQIGYIRNSSLLVSKTLAEVGSYVQPGVSTLKLDEIAESFIRDNGGIPAFKNYGGSKTTPAFPYTLCISVNEEVVHGMPSASKTLKDGDIVSVDCGVLMNGYYGDSAYTFPVGNVSADLEKLMQVTKESLYKGIEKAVAGNRMGDLSNAVESHVLAHGFTVVQEMVGHGLGENLHEPPEVPNYGKKGQGVLLKEGMVLAIEPMINLGKRHIRLAKDGWTIYAADHKASAHYEHTIVVRKHKAEILSSFDPIEFK
jgi:methionyl aminopeptidase